MDCSTPGFPVCHSGTLLKLMSIEKVMPSNHLTSVSPSILPSIFPSIMVFSNESVLRIRWPKYWSFSFSISPSSEYSRLISFRIDIVRFASLVAQMVKCLPAMRETRVRCLSWENPLEKEMATHSSILAWKISWMEPGRLQSTGSQRVSRDWAISLLLVCFAIATARMLAV